MFGPAGAGVIDALIIAPARIGAVDESPVYSMRHGASIRVAIEAPYRGRNSHYTSVACSCMKLSTRHTINRIAKNHAPDCHLRRCAHDHRVVDDESAAHRLIGSPKLVISCDELRTKQSDRTSSWST